MPRRLLRFITRLAVLALVVAGAWLAATRVLDGGSVVRAVRLVVSASPPATYVTPVRGVRAADLRSSFGAPRPGDREHQGIDILARRGTAVVAATDGIVTSTVPNRLGGKVVWVLGAGRRVYYYAHLDSIAPGIRAGKWVAAGDPIGTVGTTGNAAGGPPHLHFGIYEAATRFPPAGFRAIDPHPVLAGPRTKRGDASSAPHRKLPEPSTSTTSTG
jgi:murein DD-endopeptidase MepM/ murein hydrolase activator NlpD